MKKLTKIVSLILTLLLLTAAVSLVSCQKTKDDTTLRVAVLNGTTGFGMAPLISKSKTEDLGFNAQFDIYTAADMVSPLIINGSTDIAAVPTNLAAVLYNKTQGKVRVLAVNTLGVLYLIENGTAVNSLADLSGKTVYLPGQGSNPEFILRALVDKAGVKDVNFDYTYSSPDELATALAAGKAAIGVLPEPKVTVITSKNSSLRVALDFTEEWEKLTSAPLVQGCIVVREDFLQEHKELVKQFLEEYKKSVEYVNSNPDEASQMIVDAGLAGNAAVAKSALPRCNITYLAGKEMQTALNGYWAELYKLKPASVGGKLPDDALTKPLD